MSIALVCTHKDPDPWIEALQRLAPEIPVQVWSEQITQAEAAKVTLALCWQHPSGALATYPNLQCICSMGAGVDHLLADPKLPAAIPVVRLVDPSLADSMFQYLHALVLYYLRDLDRYRTQQQARQWQQHRSPAARDLHIGVMGMGEIGGNIARRLQQQGFPVHGWSRSGHGPEGVRCYSANELADFAAQTQILICLLPLTTATRGILNSQLFARLPQEACLINVGRGDHLVEKDLLAALANGQLRGACLDVFSQEPLPPQHPFWQHPGVLITPHSSSLTDPAAVAPQIVDHYRRLQNKQPLQHQIDVIRGY